MSAATNKPGRKPTKAGARTDKNLNPASLPSPAPVPKSRRLELTAKAGQSEDEVIAELVAAGDATSASTAIRFFSADHGDVSLTHMVAALRKAGEAANRGDLTAAERMLNSQAIALNAMFAELARRASLNMGTHLEAMESYLRLALRAQNQSRATVETLAAIKSPPVVFARQMNLAAGPQQVNNGAAPPQAEQYAPACAHPRETVSAPTELLEDSTHGSTPLDTRATTAASRAHPQLEPVGALDRPAHR